MISQSSVITDQRCSGWWEHVSDHGCPWDKAQTHESLRMQLIEEAYEAADAMLNYHSKGEIDNLREAYEKRLTK